MYFINFNFTTSCRERVHIVRMKSSDPWWTSKKHQCCHRSRWGKCQTDRQKLCDKDILFSADLVGHCINKPQNLWFKLCLSINFLNYIIQFFLEVCDEKLTVWHPDQWKKSRDFVLHCTFWGLRAMLQVSNINERLKRVHSNTLLKKLFHV